MGTADLNPDGDILVQWLRTPAQAHHLCIDEGIPPLLTEMILCQGSGSANKIDNFDMETLDINGGTITSIEVKIYHESAVPVCACIPFAVDINLGGWQGSKNYSAQTSAWENKTWSGLEGSQADLNGLQVKLTSGSLQTSSNCVTVHDTIYVYTMYVVVIWEDAPVGYTHDVMGVSAENIDNFSGVPTANIDKIKGV